MAARPAPHRTELDRDQGRNVASAGDGDMENRYPCRRSADLAVGGLALAAPLERSTLRRDRDPADRGVGDAVAAGY
jgi:hypothetical protein